MSKSKLEKYREKRQKEREESVIVARQIMTLFSENNVTIHQAQLALHQAEKFLSDVKIQSFEVKSDSN